MYLVDLVDKGCISWTYMYGALISKTNLRLLTYKKTDTEYKFLIIIIL